MAARKPAKSAAKPMGDAPPAIIAIPEVNTKDLGKIMSFADNQRRTHDAKADAERALSALVRTADEIAVEAGDIHTDDRAGSAVDSERFARKVKNLVASLEKVRESVHELAMA